MKNVVAEPLDALERFIGEWSVEGKHGALPEHRQRMHATFGADGRTMTIESEARDAGTHEMRPDMSQILTRVA